MEYGGMRRYRFVKMEGYKVRRRIYEVMRVVEVFMVVIEVMVVRMGLVVIVIEFRRVNLEIYSIFNYEW